MWCVVDKEEILRREPFAQRLERTPPLAEDDALACIFASPKEHRGAVAPQRGHAAEADVDRPRTCGEKFSETPRLPFRLVVSEPVTSEVNVLGVSVGLGMQSGTDRI